MKGVNTLILNSDQMKEILNKWWKGMTYNSNDHVIRVDIEDGNFVVELEEVVEKDNE